MSSSAGRKQGRPRESVGALGLPSSAGSVTSLSRSKTGSMAVGIPRIWTRCASSASGSVSSTKCSGRRSWLTVWIPPGAEPWGSDNLSAKDLERLLHQLYSKCLGWGADLHTLSHLAGRLRRAIQHEGERRYRHGSHEVDTPSAEELKRLVGLDDDESPFEVLPGGKDDEHPAA